MGLTKFFTIKFSAFICRKHGFESNHKNSTLLSISCYIDFIKYHWLSPSVYTLPSTTTDSTLLLALALEFRHLRIPNFSGIDTSELLCPLSKFHAPVYGVCGLRHMHCIQAHENDTNMSKVFHTLLFVGSICLRSTISGRWGSRPKAEYTKLITTCFNFYLHTVGVMTPGYSHIPSTFLSF